MSVSPLCRSPLRVVDAPRSPIDVSAVLLPCPLHPHPLDSYPDLLVGVGEVGC